MEKTVLFVAAILIASFSHAQTRRGKLKEMVVDSCTATIGIARLDNLSGFWSYKTKSVLGELDSSLYQYYPNRKSLIKIRSDDSLFFYDMRYEEPKFLFASKDQLRVDVIDDSVIGFWGKSYFLGGHDQAIEYLTPVQGELGVELLKNTAIIIDYKFNRSSTQPMKDSMGLPIIEFDSVWGTSQFLYEEVEITPGFAQGGVRDRSTKKWIIEPCANWVVKGHSRYVVEKANFSPGIYNGRNDFYYTIYDHQGVVLQDSLSELQFLGNPEYLKMMVPIYDSDSVYSKKRNITFMFPGRLYFKYEGKTGYFNLTSNHIDQKPVDFMNTSFGDVHTIIDGDSILFQLYYEGANELLFDLNAGDAYAFYPVGESDSHKDHGNFRIIRKGTDSVYIFHYEPTSDSKRSVTTVEYDRSYLKTLIEEPFSNDCFRLNMLWRYTIEVYEEGVINVTNNKKEFFDAPPKNQSGIFDLKRHKWIIENKYYSVIKTGGAYVAYLVDPAKDDTSFDTYSFDGVLLPN